MPIASTQTLLLVRLLHAKLSGMTRNYQGCVERHHEKKLHAEEGEHMKREDISKMFKDVTEEQISALLGICTTSY